MAYVRDFEDAMRNALGFEVRGEEKRHGTESLVRLVLDNPTRLPECRRSVVILGAKKSRKGASKCVSRRAPEGPVSGGKLFQRLTQSFGDYKMREGWQGRKEP